MQNSTLDRHGLHTSVLFVCMGNICRSPTVEGVFRTLVARAGLAQSIAVYSAGTHDYQLGEPPDPRAIAHARRRGYELAPGPARQVDAEDFVRSEWILAMDRHNLAELQALCPRDYRGHLGLFLDFAPESGLREVPDPYHGNTEDFERVLDLAEHGAAALLEVVRMQLVKNGR
jgi:protein-tyrosine phosphatase